tara:strand:+ start:1259 stop:1627 length:369 start_codon:yes stop_codon:yes gene_type:complete
MSILDKLQLADRDEKTATEFECSDVGIRKIRKALSMYEKRVGYCLDSIASQALFWEVCEGLGDIMTYMIAHGYNGEQTHKTIKGYVFSLSDKQYGEAILENAVRKHGAEKTVIYSSLQARDE